MCTKPKLAMALFGIILPVELGGHCEADSHGVRISSHSTCIEHHAGIDSHLTPACHQGNTSILFLSGEMIKSGRESLRLLPRRPCHLSVLGRGQILARKRRVKFPIIHVIFSAR